MPPVGSTSPVRKPAALGKPQEETADFHPDQGGNGAMHSPEARHKVMEMKMPPQSGCGGIQRALDTEEGEADVMTNPMEGANASPIAATTTEPAVVPPAKEKAVVDADVDNDSIFPSSEDVAVGQVVVACVKPGMLKFTAALPAPDLADYAAAKLRAKDTDTYKCVTSWVQDARGYSWRLMYFPYGNHKDMCYSIYLEIDPSNPEHPPPNPYCRRWVRFTLRDRSPKPYHTEVLNHEYTLNSTDWGSPKFLTEEVLKKQNPSFMTADERILVDVSIQDLSGYRNLENYDSAKETGMVGLKNQGATCYMNSLLQFLWSLRSLRRAVYAMPTEGEDKGRSVALALQRVFFRLQTESKAVSTKELTGAFGWNIRESNVQQDVQELNRVLCDRLEEKMKGTRVEGTVKALFGGKTRPTTRCLNVECQSSREEEFYDVQLDVKGYPTLKDSLDAFVRPEMMVGADQYDAEGHGKQDAERFTRFTECPPVLTIHLKRFEYNFHTGAMVKVNQRFLFPTSLDLSPYLAKEEQQLLGERVALPYCLHSVLVHSGDVDAGHYYAYVRQDDRLGFPQQDAAAAAAVEAAAAEKAVAGETMQPGNAKWFKYDDDVVTRIPEIDMLEDSFGPPLDEGGREGGVGGCTGGGIKGLTNNKASSAYMLVYVREAAWEEVMKPIDEGDIPKGLVERFKREKEEVEKKAREVREQHLYTTVELLQEADVRAFRHYINERELVTDFVSMRYGHDKLKQRSHILPPLTRSRGGDLPALPHPALPPVVKVRKEEPVAAIMLQARDVLGIPLHQQRLWCLTSRQNHTLRLDTALVMQSEEGGRKEGGKGEADKPETVVPAEDVSLYLQMPAERLLECDKSFTAVYVEDLGEEGMDGEEREEEKVVEVEKEKKEQKEEEGFLRSSGKTKRGENKEGVEDECASLKKRVRTEDKTRSLYLSSGGAARAGERVQTVEELMKFLKLYPPIPLPPNSVFIFFKAYRPKAAAVEASDPLTYLFSMHLPLSITIREVLNRLRPRISWMPEEDEAVELHEEITPGKVDLLKLESTLEANEILTGDILILQLALPPSPPPPLSSSLSLPGRIAISDASANGKNDHGDPPPPTRILSPSLAHVTPATTITISGAEKAVKSAQEKDTDFRYNLPGLPLRACHYLSYLVKRRVFRMRPYGPAEENVLQRCKADLAAAAVPGKVEVVMKGGRVRELVMEAGSDWSYQMYQQVMGGFLRGEGLEGEGSGCIRFHLSDLSGEGPSKMVRPLPSLNQVQRWGRQNSIAGSYLFAVDDQTPYREEVLYFELMPFTIAEMDRYLVRDVVLHDARLRKRAGRRLQQVRAGEEGVEVEAVGVRMNGNGGSGAEGAGEGRGISRGFCRAQGKSFKAVWTEFLPPAKAKRPAYTKQKDEKDEGEGRGEKEKRKSTEEPTAEIAGDEEEELPLVLSVLVPREGTAGDLLVAMEEALGLGSGGKEGQREAEGEDLNLELELLDTNHCKVRKVYEEDSPVRDLPETPLTARGGIIGSGTLLKAVVHALDRQERHLTQLLRSQKEGGAKAEAVESEVKPDSTPSVSSSSFETLLPLQINFLNMGADQPRPLHNAPTTLLGTIHPVGLPLLTALFGTDSWEDFLARLAGKVGRPVETLKNWTPVLELGKKLYHLPMQVQEEGEKGKGSFLRALVSTYGEGVKDFVGKSTRCSGLEKLPTLTFLAAEPVGVRPDQLMGGIHRRSRRAEQGIRIRQG